MSPRRLCQSSFSRRQRLRGRTSRGSSRRTSRGRSWRKSGKRRREGGAGGGSRVPASISSSRAFFGYRRRLQRKSWSRRPRERRWEASEAERGEQDEKTRKGGSRRPDSPVRWQWRSSSVQSRFLLEGRERELEGGIESLGPTSANQNFGPRPQFEPLLQREGRHSCSPRRPTPPLPLPDNFNKPHNMGKLSSCAEPFLPPNPDDSA